MKKSTMTLRDLNFAKTRYNIWQAFLDLIKTKNYEDITIDEVCENAEVSRSTFFNYFPSKEHLYTYYGWTFCAELFIQLNNIENKALSCYEKIKFVFNFVVKEDQQNANQFSLFVSHILRRDINIINEVKYTRADFLYKYPDKEEYFKGSKVIKLPTVGDIFYQLLREGVEEKVFRPDIDIKKTLFHLLSLLFSPPIVCKFMRKDCSLEVVYGLLLDDILDPLLVK